MSTPKRRSMGAFTLIELLAVIAIIGLLVAILVPSMGQAREIARRGPCIANLRLMGQGFHGYALNNNGWLPPTYVNLDPGRDIWDWSTNPATLIGQHLWSKGAWTWQWPDFMAPYFDPDAKPTDSGRRGWRSIGQQPSDNVYDKYTKVTGGGPEWGTVIAYTRKMNCPAQVNNNEFEYTWNPAFAWNGAAIEWWQYPRRADGTPDDRFVDPIPSWISITNTGRMGRPNMERFVQIMEPTWIWGAVWNWQGNNYANATPHQQATNTVFQDGHGETFTKDFIQKYVNDCESVKPNPVYGLPFNR